MNPATSPNDSHDELRELLSWYANSSLSDPDRERVEEHLSACAECREELSFLGALAANVTQEEPLLTSPERSFAKLRDRIDAVEAARNGRLSWRDVARIVSARVRSTIAVRGLRLRYLAATLVLLLGAGAAWTWIEGPRAGFRTLTSASPAPTDDLRVRVVWAPGTDLAEVEVLLEEVDAEIVSGPSGYGVYTLRLSTSSPEAVERTIETLRASPAVRFAEPVRPADSGDLIP